MPFDSTLSQWDDPAWHTERNYSPYVAGAFEGVHVALVHRSKERSVYLRAHDALSRLIHAPMSAHQREHLFYLLSMGNAAGGRYQEAQATIDLALDLASALDELGDICQILILRASVSRNLLRVGEAVDDLRTSLAIWGEYAEQRGKALSDVVNPALRLEVYARLSGDAFYQGDYTGAQEAVYQGRALLPLVHDNALEAATLDWTQALLCRAGQKPKDALELALRASKVYSSQSALSQVRAHDVVVCSALDIAQQMADGTERNALIRKYALPYLDKAEKLARMVDDNAGLGLVILARIRASRLLGRDEIRERQIEQVLYLARHLNDETLLAKAHAALGDEYASQGKFSRALSAYRDTLGVLDGSEVLALKRQPRVKIREIEMSGNTGD
jgi:hypothetical protein